MVRMFKVLAVEGGTLKGEVFKDDIQTAEFHQPVGFHHEPEPGAVGVLLNVGGQTSHQVLVLPRNLDVQHATGAGDTVIYGIKDGAVKSSVTLKADGDIDVSGANITLNGDGKKLVTHAELDAALSNFITVLKATLVANFQKTMSGTSGAFAEIPATPLVFDISNAATTTVKTGG